MATKFKGGFVQEYKQAQQEKAEQERLRRAHHIQDSSVVVVEKNTSVVSLLRILGRVIQTFAAILLVILAAIGILSLIYPAPRTEMIALFQEIWNHIITLF